jgi:hypothetical protein
MARHILAALKLLIRCALLLPLAANAQLLDILTGKDDSEKKEFTELEVKLPSMPQPSNLLQFEPSGASSNRFFIDAASISINDDGTVRYTLVVRSPSGAENISYEAMRCDTIERKPYAFGRRDGTWSNSRTATWQRIVYKDVNRQYSVLYADYFCPDGSPIASAKDAITRLKYGVPRDAPPRSGSKH